MSPSALSRLEADQILGKVVAEDGAPLGGWIVTAKLVENRNSTPRGAMTGSAGEFCIEKCIAGRTYLLEAAEQVTLARTPAATCLAVPGSEECTIQVPIRMLSNCWIQGVLHNEVGATPAGARIVVSDTPQFELPISVDPKTGAFRGGPFRPGPMEIFAEATGYLREDLGDRTLISGETLDLGEIVLPNAAMAAGNIELSFRHAEGEPLEQVSVELMRAAEAQDPKPTFLRRDLCGGSLWRSGELAPGDYLAIVGSASSRVGNVSQLVSVHPEETTRAQVVLSPARPTWLRIQASDSSPHPETFGNVCIRIRDALGRIVLCIDPAPSVGIPYDFSPYLTPEMYRIEVVHASGSLFSQAFEAQRAERRDPLLISWAP
ncbi:MAG: hypothetical protein JNJ88_08730 [Planctomycetes bacterium]|nr:hypothetical protein [Planctomycetota bacterium]